MGEAKEERNKTKGSPGERPRVWFQSFPCGGGIDSTTFKEDREGRREWRRRWGRFLKPPTLGGRGCMCFLGLRVLGASE